MSQADTIGDLLGELNLDGLFEKRSQLDGAIGMAVKQQETREKEAYLDGRIEGLLIRRRTDLKQARYWQRFALVVLLLYGIYGIVLEVLGKGHVQFSLLVMAAFVVWLMGGWRRAELESEISKLVKRLRGRRGHPYRESA
jgi:hypothetical protein